MMQFITEKERARMRQSFPCRIALASIVRACSSNTRDPDCQTLIRILANVLEGREAINAFGAPGDWGYGTLIGDALRNAIQENALMGPIVLAIQENKAEECGLKEIFPETTRRGRA